MNSLQSTVGRSPRKYQSQAAKKVVGVIHMHMAMLASHPATRPATVPLIVNLTGKVANFVGFPVERVKDKAIVKLVEEVQSHNKVTLLEDGHGAHILAIKFLPKFQKDLHCFMLELANGMIDEAGTQQVMSHIVIIKSLLEIIYASSP